MEQEQYKRSLEEFKLEMKKAGAESTMAVIILGIVVLCASLLML